MSTTVTDRIEKRILLRAPRSRVWRALTDAKEFGTWFQTVFAEPFRPGARIKGQITYPGYEHLQVEVLVVRMDAERLFSYRWHPNAVEPERDYSSEPMTLVEFNLEDAEGGTLLTVVESGFDGIPIARRAAALRGNEQGWSEQMKAIEDYLHRHP